MSGAAEVFLMVQNVCDARRVTLACRKGAQESKHEKAASGETKHNCAHMKRRKRMTRL